MKKNHFSNKASCPACGRTMRRHDSQDGSMVFWRCGSCSRSYSDSAGTPGTLLPLTLPQVAGIVGLADRYKNFDGFKKAYDLQGMSRFAILAQLEQAVEEGFLEVGPGGGFFVLTERGQFTLAERVHTCPTCGGVAILATPEGAPDFWKCIECGVTAADEDGTPAAPQACEKCGKNAVTRYESADFPGKFFWGCGACRCVFEDVEGKIGRCFDDIDE